MSAIVAIQQVFPKSTIRGCYFLYTQCIWRKVQELGLVIPFRNNAEVHRMVRRLCALPLCPLQQLNNAWTEIMAEVPREVPFVENLLDYFLFTWFHETQALFRRDIWNHHDGDGIRTNNHLEGWHLGFNQSIGTIHPNIFKFVTALKKEQGKVEGIITLLEAGNEPPKRKLKYRSLEEKHTRLERQYRLGERNLLSYLTAVGYLIRAGDM